MTRPQLCTFPYRNPIREKCQAASRAQFGSLGEKRRSNPKSLLASAASNDRPGAFAIIYSTFQTRRGSGCFPLCLPSVFRVHHIAGRRIEVERRSDTLLAEVEHRPQIAGQRVERVVADAAGLPVVFDKPDDRSLVGHAVVNLVLLRPR